MVFWCFQGVEKASNVIEKETLVQVFFCEFFEIFKNTYFKRTASSGCFCRKGTLTWNKIRPNPSNIPSEKSVFIGCSFTQAKILPMAFLQLFFIFFKNVLFFKTLADGCFSSLHVLLIVLLIKFIMEVKYVSLCCNNLS